MRFDRAHVRNSDPETSIQAADSVTDLNGKQQKVLEALRRYGPMTDEQLIAMGGLGMSPSGARSRRAELVDRGLVQDTGARSFTQSGRRTIIWAVTK